MSGRHRRPEPDALTDVDVAADLTPGPVIDTTLDGPITATDPTPAGLPPATAILAGPTIVARRGRAAEREARRARDRRRAMTVGSAALVVLLLIGVIAVVLSGGDSKAKAPPSSTGPRQSTLLIQVAGQDGTAAASALVGLTPATGLGAAVLVPSGLLVNVASSGDLPFGETVTLPSPRAPADALTDVLGVRVQNNWLLSQKAFAALIDKVGGVQVTVDTDVLSENAKGDDVVVVRAGRQKLTGAAAAAYATYLAEGEPQTVGLARFNDVFDAVVARLPDSETSIASLVKGLSTGSRATLPVDRLAGLLLDLRASAADEKLHYDVLPVKDIDTGAATDTYGLDTTQAESFLRSLFAGSLLKDPGGDTVRVLVENGVGTPDLVDKARTRLVADGFRFINGGNASDLSATDVSHVLIEDGSAKSQARGARVAKSLKLPTSSIEINPRGQTVADVIVILGTDFKP